MGTDWADLADTQPGNKVNSMLRILGRVLHVFPEQRLTMGFMATVRGRLEKGRQQVSEQSALIPNLPLYKLAKPWFSIKFSWPLNSWGVEFYEWEWWVGGWGQLDMAELRFHAIALGEASKTQSDGWPALLKFKPYLQAHPCKPGLWEKASS